MQVTVYPDRSLYAAKQPVCFTIKLTDLANDIVHIELTVTHLHQQITKLETTIAGQAGQDATAHLKWTLPPESPCGYGVTVVVLDPAGHLLATAETACDVLDHWTQAPRYGFLCDFTLGRQNIAETAAWLNRHHINAIQFYDWMYRHDHLLPSEDPFIDPLGRSLSLTTVNQLIDALHERGIAAMPYTAVYAASKAFQAAHAEWSLFQKDGQPHIFMEDFLMIMDPTNGSSWQQHLMAQFKEVLEKTNFDGIHIDQYGQPRDGFNAAGAAVSLPDAFRDFIASTQELVHQQRGEQGAVVFNAVENWPIETLAPSEQDITYIEIWPPDTGLKHLHEYIVNAQQLALGKPVVMACYVTPEWAQTAVLVTATIFASGGFHISLGEPGGFLSDPYFPEYGRMSESLQTTIGRYYDFLVRYENVLSLGTIDTTAESPPITIEGVPVSRDAQGGTVWAVTKTADQFETLSLINLTGVPTPTWSDEQPQPTPLKNPLTIHYTTTTPIQQIWTASPDGETLAARLLPFDMQHENGEQTIISFTLPQLTRWSLIVLQK